MITSLTIKNYALIEKLSIDFSKGFSTITGETGAGKSIILGALGLVLGKRADLTSLKNKEEKCIIEAQFEISKYNLTAFFAANDMDYENETIIRREILPSGKSRAFVNDSPVNLQELQELGVFLIDIHSQHQTHELSEEKFQFQIIDSIAGNLAELSKYQQLLKEFKKEKALLNSAINKQKDSLKEQEYNTFLVNELIDAKLVSGEQEFLEAEFEKLNNVESIKEALEKSISIANDEQLGVLQNLKEIKGSIQKIASFSPEYAVLLERISSVMIEFDDVSSDLSTFSEKLINDPEKLVLTGQKLQQIFTLQKKHQVATIDDLILIQVQLEKSLLEITNLESEIAVLESSISNKELELYGLGGSIHDKRLLAIPILSEKIIAILESLGMPNTRFDIQLNLATTFFENGLDELIFLFSANKGSDFGILKKVASGGELSRIMLAVKAILAQYSKLPTLIFDEIDTGVSGEIAHKMGDIMQQMSQVMQIFAITHLPQIAAKGESHFKVFKSTLGDDTVSELKLLSQEERIVEIAQMLSGTVVSDSALNHAKALLN